MLKRSIKATYSVVGAPTATSWRHGRHFWSWSRILTHIEEQDESGGRVTMGMDPLMKKRLHYFEQTDRDLAWLTDRERSKEVRAAIFERLLMEEALSQDTIKDSRFWALRNLYGTKRDVNGTAIDTRGAPDGVYVPVSEGTWERCRSQADWAFSLLLCNRDALGFAARQEREGPSADEVAEASGGERDSEQGGEGEAVAGPRQGDVGDEKGGGNGGEEGREGGEAEGAGGGSEGGGLEVEPWDYHDYQGYAEAFTSRLGGWSPEEERRRRDELGRAAVFFSARPDAEVPSLNRVVAGAGELFEDWSRGMLTAQYREKLEGTEPFKKEKGEGEGGEEMMEGGAVFAMLDSVDQVHGQLELLHRGSEAMMIQWAGEKETQARQMLQAARVKDDNVVEWVPGPALKRVYGVDPRNRSTWYLYDFAMGGNGSAPEVNAYLSDGAKARMFVKNQLFPSVFTVQRLAAEHKVRPQRVLGALAMRKLELGAALFGLPLDEMAHDNAREEERQLGHAFRSEGTGLGGRGAERRVVRVKTFPWRWMRNMTREEYEKLCEKHAEEEEETMVQEMANRARWNLGLTGRSISRRRLTRTWAMLRRPAKGKAWPMLVEMTDKHLKSNDPTRDLDEKAFVVDGEGRMRALTQDEKDAARKRMALPRLSWFRHRVPYKPPREPQRKSKRG